MIIGTAAQVRSPDQLRVIVLTADSAPLTPPPHDGAGSGHPGPPGPRRRPRALVLALGVVVLCAFGYVAATAFSGSVVYYRTPTEVASAPGVHVRLSGSVVAGSIRQALGHGITFLVTDGKSTIQVAYPGARPAALRDGGDVVAEGVLAPGGLFQASALVTKCPSKFEKKTGANGG